MVEKQVLFCLPPLGSFSIKLGSDVGPIPGWGIFTPTSPEKYKIFFGFFWEKLFQQKNEIEIIKYLLIVLEL